MFMLEVAMAEPRKRAVMVANFMVAVLVGVADVDECGRLVV